MLAQVRTAAVFGIEGHVVLVEVDISKGLPDFHVVGLPDAAVRESRERVRAAVKNSGFSIQIRRITVNLAPAALRKEGSSFDLPIALGILAAAGEVPTTTLNRYLFVGELSLDGGVRPAKGVLPMALAARAHKVAMVVPQRNAREASVIDELEVLGVCTLKDVVRLLRGEVSPNSYRAFGEEDDGRQIRLVAGMDFVEVRGQAYAKRALEIAAAGGHNVLMIGPPGSGKTMLAERIPGILPFMTRDEALEVTKIYSIAGLLEPGISLITVKPFRRPHHTISGAGLIGSGRISKPGEVTLAHRGVLFLDELSEFRRDALEGLRQPLEEGRVVISRASFQLVYPARVMVIAAMNPCQCGFFGDPDRECVCAPAAVQRYRSRVSGPLLDRIDIHVEVSRVRPEDLTRDFAGEVCGETSASIRARVARARAVQEERYKGKGISCNAEMGNQEVAEFCHAGNEAKALLYKAVDCLGLSARGYMHVLKVARTIADLAGEDSLRLEHAAEAIQHRSFERRIKF